MSLKSDEMNVEPVVEMVLMNDVDDDDDDNRVLEQVVVKPYQKIKSYLVVVVGRDDGGE
jgi:hypothetical protein